MGLRIGKKKTGKNSKLAAARRAVKKYEAELKTLEELNEEFARRFPKAHQFLTEISTQEGAVQDAINAAVPLVREAKQDVGDFKCTLKRSKAGYDDSEFTELLSDAEDGGNIVMDLLTEGCIKKVVLDPSAAAYFAQHPDDAEYFESSWRKAENLTPAVTPPKF
jgi:hypothetical protein